ncbi:MAG: 23S rRNA (guanosine(2251)-2'-O)-methyltransferase RlmB [Armatimonadetes bacterium]|nr:23S rRNA (guanosine(2251)-2'-O)-methyltransferase RlmB [Armatimonadota bacterium]
MSDLLLGRHAVREALRAGRPLRRLYVARGARVSSVLRDAVEEARRRGVFVEFVERRRLDDLSHGQAHQGVVAVAAAHAAVEVDEILARAREKGRAPFVVVLDGIEDPANLGAIIRTAEAAGAHGVIIPRHRAAGLTAAVARASAGAIEFLPVAQATNLARTLEDCKREGLWVVGADMDAPARYDQVELRPPLAVVIGGEGRGLGRLVRERCDRLVRIPLLGRVGSLNASAAAAVLLYEVVRQQGAEGVAPLDAVEATSV